MDRAKLVEDLRGFLSERTSVAIEPTETDLVEAGVLDSLALIELLLYLETAHQIQIPIHEIQIDDLRSLSKIASLVDRWVNAPADGTLSASRYPKRVHLPD